MIRVLSHIKVKSCLLSAIFFLIGSGLFGQTAKEQKAQIKVIARPLPDMIKLRWAPNNSTAWHYANQSGYMIERYTLARDGNLLEQPEKKILNTLPIKPLPLEKWESLVKNDKYAAIAAQALYGKSFDVSTKNTGDILQMINSSKEQESRFSFALFSADQSFAVAEASGLSYVDKSALKNEKYLYKVFAAIPSKIASVDTGFVFTGISEYEELPVPIHVKAEFSENTALISWNGKYFESIFNSFIVERSDDNQATFKAINKEPIVNSFPEGKEASERIYFVDSFPENNKQYFYRVKGISPFGELSKPSEVVSGTGEYSIALSPAINSTEVNAENHVKIMWDFPQELEYKIKGFSISRSDNANGPFKTIGESIKNSIRDYTDRQPLNTGYYIVNTLGNNNSILTKSFPYLVQLIDSIPPKVPSGLTGVVDSTGVVKLSWLSNTEGDLLGYRIYRSNFVNSEFSQVTINPVERAEFVDTVNVKTLTDKVFYKVTAIDNRFNPSDFSTVLELKKPDILPPVSPVFTGVKASEKGIELYWNNSSSIDVEAHLLYRRQEGSEKWQLIEVFHAKDSVKFYSDETVTFNKTYEYTLIALDENKLESLPCATVKAKRIDTGKRPPIEKVFAKADREIKQISIAWEYHSADVERYVVYKAKEGDPLKMYKSVQGDTKILNDKVLIPNSTYKYLVKAMFKDGSQSPLSRELVVKY